MTIARSIASPIARSIASPLDGAGGGGAPTFDADALDYFSRAELLGGSFDQSGINATYTETYVKTAISNFVAGCKTDGVWPKLTEAYLLAGTSFAGVTAKLKYLTVPTLTNANFVSGDYVAAGIAAGAKGNSTTKTFDTSLVSTLASDKSLSAYITEADSNAGSVFYMQAGVSGTVNGHLLAQGSGGTMELYQNGLGAGSYAGMTVTRRNGYLCGTDRTTTDRQMFRNGVSTGTNVTPQSAADTTSNYALFGSPNGISVLTNARISFFHIGTGLTPSQAIALSSRVNALMTALGSNVY